MKTGRIWCFAYLTLSLMAACHPVENNIQPQKSQPRVIAEPHPPAVHPYAAHEVNGKWEVLTGGYKVQPEVVESQPHQAVLLSQ